MTFLFYCVFFTKSFLASALNPEACELMFTGVLCVLVVLTEGKVMGDINKCVEQRESDAGIWVFSLFSGTEVLPRS